MILGSQKGSQPVGTDRIYSQPLQQVGQFRFDDTVAEVFDDMIARSVPGYGAMLSMTRVLVQRFALPNTRIYDLGCSLGAAVLLIRPHVPANTTIVAVDNSAAMLQRFRDRLRQQDEKHQQHADQPTPDAMPQVTILQQDIRDTEITDASCVIMNLTLQFIPAGDRRPLLERIQAGLHEGGALLLSEKVCFDDPAVQHWQTELHHDFKRAQGYSDLEIAQKRTALENTLIPETIQTHTQRLLDVGFSQALLWFQCFNFVSFLAIK